MGLYLCVFDGEEELEGVEVGSYDDFAYLRDAVCQHLEGGEPGSRFPTLMLHSDSDGSWTFREALVLKREIEEVARAFEQLPPIQFNSSWQREASKMVGLRPRTLRDCFIDVDGEPLLERLVGLCEVAMESRLPILFQ